MKEQENGNGPIKVSDRPEERGRATPGNRDGKTPIAAYGLFALKRVLGMDVGYFEKELTYRAGLESAAQCLSDLLTPREVDDPQELLASIVDVCARGGFGQIAVHRIDLIHQLIEFTCHDSAETIGYLQSGEIQRSPSCSYTSGFLAGIGKLVFPVEGKEEGDDEIIGMELECISKGDSICRFIVAPKSALAQMGLRVQPVRESISEHTLRLNEEILARNLDLQNLNLDLERQVRKRTEDLTRSDEKYRSLIDLSPDPIVICTLGGMMRTVNEAAYEMLGCRSDDELVNAGIETYLLDGKDAWDRCVWQIDKEGIAKGQTIVFIGRDGQKIVGDISARFTTIHSEKCVHLVIRDVSEKSLLRVKMEQAMNDSAFFNDLLSHDIINYMTASMHFLDTMRRSADLSDKDRKAVGVVAKNIKGAFELAAVVRDLSKADALDGEESESRDLSQAMSEAVEETRTIFFDRKVSISMEVPRNGCYARANPLLGRLFVNLLTNAVKFDSKPEVKIKVIAQVETHNNKEFWCIRIMDNGKGIPDQDKEKIFERYFRGDDTVPGTGLGLHVVRKIANACGGIIWAENHVPGDHKKGTTMVVLLEKVPERTEHRLAK
ncbi:MAG: PAS domain S-box protein [Candidatus Thermoplasmatota archaeon]|nr:PAS domain S-box protein [Candidatus Thermoplasmatota archaeon]